MSVDVAVVDSLAGAILTLPILVTICVGEFGWWRIAGGAWLVDIDRL
jgi:hypothetical protein